MENIFLATGGSAYDTSLDPIGEDSFGVRYVTYRNIFRFLEQIEDLDVGLIVWPGGSLAELHEDRYGFEFDGLYNPDTGKPSLAEMMLVAIDNGAGLSIVLPTVRYVGREDELRADVQDFMQDLLGGYFGMLPDQMILEIGNEYYSTFTDPSDQGAAADYAHLADIMITEIALALADPGVNTTGSDVAIAVQSGRTFADDEDIRAGLSEFSISNAEMIIQHRFPGDAEQVEYRMIELDKIIDAWQAESYAVESEAPELFLSGWNVAHVTRNSVLEDFLQEQALIENGLQKSDVDLVGRSTTEFEQFWQDTLDGYAYGAEHPGVLLELFSAYTGAGMTAAGVYGVDTMHPGRLSWYGEDGESHTFVGGEMLKMIFESVSDTYLLPSGADYSSDNLVTPYIFENDDKLVVFMAAGQNGAGEYTLDIEGLGDIYGSVWGESLGAAITPGWMETFGIVDNPLVDETPEAATYAAPVREAISPKLTEDGLVVSISEPHEVVRLAFAKTAAGAEEIASWSLAPEIQLLDFDIGVVPVDTFPDPEEEPDEVFDDGSFDMTWALLLFLLFA
ncbi:MAG: hypothetical protein ACU0DI_08115 [Paracoccaceae bacterium]